MEVESQNFFGSVGSSFHGSGRVPLRKYTQYESEKEAKKKFAMKRVRGGVGIDGSESGGNAKRRRSVEMSLGVGLDSDRLSPCTDTTYSDNGENGGMEMCGAGVRRSSKQQLSGREFSHRNNIMVGASTLGGANARGSRYYKIEGLGSTLGDSNQEALNRLNLGFSGRGWI